MARRINPTRLLEIPNFSATMSPYRVRCTPAYRMAPMVNRKTTQIIFSRAEENKKNCNSLSYSPEHSGLRNYISIQLSAISHQLNAIRHPTDVLIISCPPGRSPATLAMPTGEAGRQDRSDNLKA